MAKADFTSQQSNFDSPLPGFIVDQDNQALAAGLRIERLPDKRSAYCDRIVTNYHGLKEQIEASGFIETEYLECFRWPRGHCPTSNWVKLFSEDLGEYGKVYRNVDGTFRLARSEACPRNLTRPGEELERYEVFGYDGHDRRKRDHRRVAASIKKIVHYGSKRALLAAGIAQEDDLPDDQSMTERRGTSPLDRSILWRTMRAPNGWWIHTRNVDMERRIQELNARTAKEGQEKRRQEVGFGDWWIHERNDVERRIQEPSEQAREQTNEDGPRTPEEFRERLMRSFDGGLGALLAASAGELWDKKPRMWLHADALQRLMELRGTVLSVIEHAEVMVEPAPGLRPKHSAPKLTVIQGGVR